MSFPLVTIYTTKACGYCKATKALLEKHEVSYTEINVGSDSEKAREMVEISGQMGVPVVLIGKKGSQQIVIGFDEEKIKELLHL